MRISDWSSDGCSSDLALVRYAAPVLVFTSEEVWGTRYPDAGSVHLLEWPTVDAAWNDAALAAKWASVRAQREAVTEAIEPYRREKTIRSSPQAEVTIPDPTDRKSGVSGKSVSVRVDLGGRRIF